MYEEYKETLMVEFFGFFFWFVCVFVTQKDLWRKSNNLKLQICSSKELYRLIM